MFALVTALVLSASALGLILLTLWLLLGRAAGGATDWLDRAVTGRRPPWCP